MDLVAAAGVNSAALLPEQTNTALTDEWIDTWTVDDLQAVIRDIALGRASEAQRRVMLSYAAWRKATDEPTRAVSRRTLGELRCLAKSLRKERLVKEAQEHVERQKTQRQERESELRRVMSSADQFWEAANEQALRGSASGYDEALHVLETLAQAYALVDGPDAFERHLRRFLVPHARRGALLRRLVEAGLWEG